MIIIQTVPKSELALMQIVLLSFFNYDQYLLLQDLDPELINFIPELTLWESFLYMNGSHHKNPGRHSHTQGQLKAWIFSVVAVNMRILNSTVDDFSRDFAQWVVGWHYCNPGASYLHGWNNFHICNDAYVSRNSETVSETEKQSQAKVNSSFLFWHNSAPVMQNEGMSWIVVNKLFSEAVDKAFPCMLLLKV